MWPFETTDKHFLHWPHLLVKYVQLLNWQCQKEHFPLPQDKKLSVKVLS